VPPIALYVDRVPTQFPSQIKMSTDEASTEENSTAIFSSGETPTESMEELTTRHKKELKVFEGEKRAAMKTAKGKGKKAKSAIKDAEFKYEGLERDLKERHRLELDALEKLLNDVSISKDEVGTIENAGTPNDLDANNDEYSRQKEETQTSAANDSDTITANNEENSEDMKRQKALAKKLKKKNQARQKVIDRQNRIAEENANAGPSRREMETDALVAMYLKPRSLSVEEVEADGHCLYRAVAKQCARVALEGVGDGKDYAKLRSICANVLLGPNRGEYEPFAEFGDGHDGHHSSGGDHPATYEEYVEKVRSSAVWGGQLELRALSEGLHCPIVVFSAEGPPLTMGAEYYGSEIESGDCNWGSKKALLLSFHRHYYALGEHYNSVVPENAS